MSFIKLEIFKNTMFVWSDHARTISEIISVLGRPLLLQSLEPANLVIFPTHRFSEELSFFSPVLLGEAV